MITIEYLRTVGEVQCCDCASMEQKRFMYRSGHADAYCAQCEDVTSHAAFDAKALSDNGLSFYSENTVEE